MNASPGLVMRAAFFIVLCYERGPEGKVKQILTNGLTRAPDVIGRLLMRDTSVFDWIKTDPRRKAIREDRRYVVGRTERFLAKVFISRWTSQAAILCGRRRSDRRMPSGH
jgi:hypothetical protein